MKTIWVCTDFSSTGNNAVKYAIQYAAAMKYHLVVFHVVHMPKFNPTISEAEFLQLKKKEEDKQKLSLENLVDKIHRDLHLKRNESKVKVAAKNGIFVTETLVAATKNQKADLIIVGTHGATGLKLLGSISSEIIFKAQAPVLAIPPRYRYKKMKRMVYAADFKNLVNELLLVVQMASPVNAVIEILNFGVSNTNTFDERKLMKQVKYKKLKVILQEERQSLPIIEQLQNYLKNHQAEVLVMFPDERSVFDKLFVRSKTEKLIYQIKIPLLTILKSRVTQ